MIKVDPLAKQQRRLMIISFSLLSLGLILYIASFIAIPIKQDFLNNAT